MSRVPRTRPQEDSEEAAGGRGDDYGHERREKRGRERKKDKKKGGGRRGWSSLAASLGTVARSGAPTPSPPLRSLSLGLARARAERRRGGRSFSGRTLGRRRASRGSWTQPEVALAFWRRDATSGSRRGSEAAAEALAGGRTREGRGKTRGRKEIGEEIRNRRGMALASKRREREAALTRGSLWTDRSEFGRSGVKQAAPFPDD